MATTNKYDVKYEDGRERVKRLSKEDADTLEKDKGVKSVSRKRESGSRKSSGSSKQSGGQSKQSGQSKSK